MAVIYVEETYPGGIKKCITNYRKWSCNIIRLDLALITLPIRLCLSPCSVLFHPIDSVSHMMMPTDCRQQIVEMGVQTDFTQPMDTEVERELSKRRQTITTQKRHIEEHDNIIKVPFMSCEVSSLSCSVDGMVGVICTNR